MTPDSAADALVHSAAQPYALSRRPALTRSRKEREFGEGSYAVEEEECVAAKRLCHSKERLTVVLDMDEVRAPNPES